MRETKTELMLKSIGLDHEKTSPYFQRNKEVCEQYDKELSEYGATVSGSYGAWAFKCVGNFTDFPKTRTEFEKSTFTRDATLLFQAVFSLSLWIINAPTLKGKVKIRKSLFFDYLGVTRFKRIKGLGGYRIRQSKGSDHKLTEGILETLRPAMQTNDIYLVQIENEELTIRVESTDSYTSTLKDLKEQIKNYES
jgi:hypothetical protein